MQSGTFSICNMGMSSLPDMYTLKHWGLTGYTPVVSGYVMQSKIYR